MKFNEKLIELRKKNGFSQEELGAKLNVARQTVSKWELGETTPEMDKLIELSKIFEISIDELTGNTDYTSNSRNYNGRIKMEYKKLYKIIIGVLSLCFFILIFCFGGNIIDKIFNIGRILGNALGNCFFQ